jgi:hypothetical protein
MALLNVFRECGLDAVPGESIGGNNWGFYLYRFGYRGTELSIEGFRGNKAIINFPCRRIQDVTHAAASCQICKLFHSAVIKHNRNSPASPILRFQTSLHVDYAKREELTSIDATLYSHENENEDLDFESTSSIQLCPVKSIIEKKTILRQ